MGTLDRPSETPRILSHYGDSRMAKYNRNTGKSWTPAQVAQLKSMARQNTPTRVIGLKLGRTEDAVRSKASEKGVSLKPTNQSPYNRRRK